MRLEQDSRWGEKREVHRKCAVGVREQKGQETDRKSETLKLLRFHRWE